MRVSRSFELFGLLSPIEKVFGIGLQNQALYLNANGIILPGDLNETLAHREFAATIGYLLCTCGLLGLVTFLSMFVPLFRNKGGRPIVLACLLLGIAATCCVFSRGIFIVMLLLLFAYGSGIWVFDEAEDANHEPEP